MMKAISILLFALIAYSSAQTVAVAYLYGTNQDAGVTGWVKFTQVGTGLVNVTVNLMGITQGPDILHGIHIHVAGDLTDQAGSLSTLGHFNPFNQPHGCPENGTVRHVGDMGNWQATGGVIMQTKMLDLIQLTGNTSVVGRAVVLHQGTDDCVTITAYGSRLAHGIIGIVDPAVNNGTNEAVQQSTSLIPAAVCVLRPASGSNVTGTVWLYQSTPSGAVDVYAKVDGITGEHGFHLHWWGDISNPNGLATGGHYNPLNDLHGVPPALPRHKGDMGIIYHYNNGVAYYQYSNPILTLNGQYNVIGRAIHVHAGSDDCSNPVGNGGARIAQCVIGAASNTTLPAFPAGVPTTQNGTTICTIIRGSSASSASSASTVQTSASSASNSGTDEGSNVATLIASFAIIFAMLFLSF